MAPNTDAEVVREQYFIREPPTGDRVSPSVRYLKYRLVPLDLSYSGSSFATNTPQARLEKLLEDGWILFHGPVACGLGMYQAVTRWE